MSESIPTVKIKVVGVGGSGCNALNTMIRSGFAGVEFITANTDKQALEISLAQTKIAIGQELTRGLGAGANPEIGRLAALEDAAKVSQTLSNTDLIFVTAGMGGGTGTGAAPIFAKVAKEQGALVVGVVTRPFQFEGKKRQMTAEMGINELREHVDLLVIIPNQRLLSLSKEPLPMIAAFRKADEVLLNAVKGIADLISQTGLINSDFAHVKTIMKSRGHAIMGVGEASGENRAVEAARSAISSPLLEDTSIQGATGIIVNITAGSDLSIQEVDQATSLIMEAVHEDAEIIFGTIIDESLGNSVKITVVATGLPFRPMPQHGTTRLASQAQQAQAAPLQPKAGASAQPAGSHQAPTAHFSFSSPVMEVARSNAASAQSASASAADLTRARDIGEKLGITDLDAIDLGAPSFAKRPPPREV